MPFNGSGTFTRLENWSNDAANNLPISATKFDIEDNDFASGLTNCLTRDGQGPPTGALTWAQPLTLNRPSDGTELTIGRTGGSNNPQLQISVQDVGGFILGTSIATGIQLAIAGVAALGIASTRAVTIAAPTAGDALTVAGSINVGNNIGGPTSAFAYTIGANPPATSTAGGYVQLFGSTNAQPSLVVIGTANSTRVSVGPNGNVTIGAPSSGTALTIAAASGAQGINLTGISGATIGSDIFIGRTSSTANTNSAGPNTQLIDTGAVTATQWQHSGGQSELWQFNSGAWNQILKVLSTRGVVINGPASGNTLALTGIAGAITLAVSNATAGVGYAASFSGGTAKVPLLLNVAATLPAIDYGNYVTGAATATFTAANKPGGAAAVIGWVAVGNGAGTITGYMPVFGP